MGARLGQEQKTTNGRRVHPSQQRLQPNIGPPKPCIKTEREDFHQAAAKKIQNLHEKGALIKMR